MPLFWLSVAFLSGVVLGGALGWPTRTWLILAAICLVLLLLNYLLKRFSGSFASRLPHFHLLPSNFHFPLPFFLLLFVLTLGGARYQSAQPAITPDFIAYYNDQGTQLVVEGLLVAPPNLRETDQQLRVQVARLSSAGGETSTSVKGLLLANLPLGSEWRYGDRLQLTGRLQTPPIFEDFSYRDYLARQGIYSYMPQTSASLAGRDQGNRLMAGVYRFKDRCVAVIYQLLPDPEASLLAGILLGVYSGIPANVTEAFRAAGVSHIIVISGFNMTIVAGLFAVLFGRLFGRRWGAVAAVSGIAMYTLLVGATPSVVRAAIMAGLSLFAAQVGRRQDGINTLAFIAALMALYNPNVLWDVSFQLTFLATLGLVLYAEPLSQAFMRLTTRYLPVATAERLARPAGEYFLFTIAAQVTTLAVMAYYFQRVSLVSLLSNPLILPAQPAVEILGGLALILGLISQPLGQIMAYLAWPFLVYTIRVAEWFAALPVSAISLGQVALPLVLLFYALLIGITFAGPTIKKLGPVLKPSIVLSTLGVLVILTWRAVLALPDGRLHLTVLDVGSGGRSGDAILIQTPAGRSLLIDGGPSTSQLSDALGRRLPLGQRHLDWLVVAASQDGQVGGLRRNLDRFSPAGVLWANPSGGTTGAGEVRQDLADLSIDITPAQAGQAFDLGNGASLHVLAVGSQGAVLLVEWQGFRALLPVGLDERLLKDLLVDPNLGPVNALFLAGYGDSLLNPPEWIAKLRPNVLLLSVDPSDSKNQPEPAFLQNLQGYNLLRTDLNGWIEVSTDGEQMWVEVERR